MARQSSSTAKPKASSATKSKGKAASPAEKRAKQAKGARPQATEEPRLLDERTSDRADHKTAGKHARDLVAALGFNAASKDGSELKEHAHLRQRHNGIIRRPAKTPAHRSPYW
mgnify:CR=1 FL=1